MAHAAWVAMTRVMGGGICWSSPEARVDAGMKELIEMTIGRTDDPENPISVPAFEAAKLFLHVPDCIGIRILIDPILPFLDHAGLRRQTVVAHGAELSGVVTAIVSASQHNGDAGMFIRERRVGRQCYAEALTSFRDSVTGMPKHRCVARWRARLSLAAAIGRAEFERADAERNATFWQGLLDRSVAPNFRGQAKRAPYNLGFLAPQAGDRDGAARRGPHQPARRRRRDRARAGCRCANSGGILICSIVVLPRGKMVNVSALPVSRHRDAPLNV